MGARIAVENERIECGEPLADLVVGASGLAAATFGGDEIVTMIDELPVLALAATQARGTTRIRDAAELRVKETDRIATTAAALGALGASVAPLADGLVIEGPTPLEGGTVGAAGDHRIAMTLAVAGLVSRRGTCVTDAQVASDSFPGFDEALRSLGAVVEAS
jgi:3-phosphoshikimate 1-carboxyvinyltransferase